MSWKCIEMHHCYVSFLIMDHLDEFTMLEWCANLLYANPAVAHRMSETTGTQMCSYCAMPEQRVIKVVICMIHWVENVLQGHNGSIKVCRHEDPELNALEIKVLINGSNTHGRVKDLKQLSGKQSLYMAYVSHESVPNFISLGDLECRSTNPTIKNFTKKGIRTNKKISWTVSKADREGLVACHIPHNTNKLEAVWVSKQQCVVVALAYSTLVLSPNSLRMCSRVADRKYFNQLSTAAVFPGSEDLILVCHVMSYQTDRISFTSQF